MVGPEKKYLADGTVAEIGMMVTRADHVSNKGTWAYYLGEGEITEIEGNGCYIKCIEPAGEDGNDYAYAVSHPNAYFSKMCDLKRVEDHLHISFDESEFFELLN